MFNVSVNDVKAAARKSASDQCDAAVTAGTMTAAQKAAVLAQVDALPGPHVTGSVSGQAETAGVNGAFRNA
jgi:hypothetical protein